MKMKKRLIFFITILLMVFMLFGCTEKKEKDLNINLDGGYLESCESNTFLSVPYKNNAIFMGWNSGDNIIEYYDEAKRASFAIDNFKKYQVSSQIWLEPLWYEVDVETYFKYVYLPDEDGYEIGMYDKMSAYPREISIPDTYQGKKVVKISDNGFSDLEELVIVNLGKNITTIGNEAFKNTSLININIDDQLIGEDAFYNTLINKSMTSLKGFTGKRIEIGSLTYYLNVRLDDAYFIEEEMLGFLPTPLKENFTFKGWNVANLDYYDLNYGSDGVILTIKEYFSLQDKEVKALWEEISPLAFNYVYDNNLDGYMIGLNTDTYPRDLILPIQYQGKAIVGILEEGFSSGKNIVKLELPDTIKYIGKNAFYKENVAFDLREINIPRQIVAIEDNAFCNTQISFAIDLEELSYLGSRVFYNTFIKHVVIPNSLKEIDFSSFKRCRDLEFKISPTHPSYSLNTANGNYLVLSKDEKTLIFASMRLEIVLAKGIEVIGEDAFSDGEYNRITLPETVTTISKRSFKNATVTKGVNIPEGLISVGEEAFYNYYTENTTISFGHSLQSIGKNAFTKANIVEYKLSYGITRIDDEAFSTFTYSSLQRPNFKITIPKSISYLGKNSLSAFDEITFLGNPELTNVIVTKDSKKDIKPLEIYITSEFFLEMQEKLKDYVDAENVIFFEK